MLRDVLYVLNFFIVGGEVGLWLRTGFRVRLSLDGGIRKRWLKSGRGESIRVWVRRIFGILFGSEMLSI